TRSDIIKLYQLILEYLINSSPKYLRAVNYLIFYLKEIKNLAIKFSSSSILFYIVSNASFADNQDYTSLIKYIIYLFNNFIN
ncbi:hypothetical protein BO70DRAFT_303325, partial [Aspergillus heteromorphus CBS 117.55]